MMEPARVADAPYFAMNFAALHSHLSEPSTAIDHGQLQFGITRAEFLKNYFEQRWLLRRGAHRDSKFDWSDVDELLYRIEPKLPDFQLFQDGEVPHAEFVDEFRERGVERRCINKTAFYDRMGRGATLVLNRLEQYSLCAKRLCSEIGRYAGHPASTNAYLSFGGNGTFGKHWDTHDVFVVQLLGTKRWQVFPPTTPLPLSHQTSKPHRGQAPTYPELDIKLNPGDVLYLPRGWWHQVIPCATGSFHLSIGVYPPTAIDYLQWAARRCLATIPVARAGIGEFKIESLDVDSLDQRLTEALHDPKLLAMYKESLFDCERSRTEFNLALLLKSNHGELAPDTLVVLSNCYAQGDTLDLLISNWRRGADAIHPALCEAVLPLLANASVLCMRDIYAKLGDVSQADISTAILDLARRDVVNVWRG